MAVNTHPHSGHLLCHDDVIGDRAVSFIIYLVDPDGWSADDGGALELYPLEDPTQVIRFDLALTYFYLSLR
jgi:Rps23 Pro-64 3,4-dihydroxylase Tpa1-like proline 4-hydroxylase